LALALSLEIVIPNPVFRVKDLLFANITHALTEQQIPHPAFGTLGVGLFAAGFGMRILWEWHSRSDFHEFH
jgi:hypothetical protein